MSGQFCNHTVSACPECASGTMTTPTNKCIHSGGEPFYKDFTLPPAAAPHTFLTTGWLQSRDCICHIKSTDYCRWITEPGLHLWSVCIYAYSCIRGPVVRDAFHPRPTRNSNDIAKKHRLSLVLVNLRDRQLPMTNSHLAWEPMTRWLPEKNKRAMAL